MSIIIGLILGAGLLMIWWSFWPRPANLQQHKPSKLRDLIDQTSIEHFTIPGVVTVSVVLAAVVFIILVALTGTVPIGLSFAIFASYAPWGLLNWQARRRQTRLREIWPDAIDNLRSAVRAGLTLP